MHGTSIHRRRRTPQACVTCRRRKTKCDGVRPRCRHCSSRSVPCVWPSLIGDPNADIDVQSGVIYPGLSAGSDDALSSVKLPDAEVMQLCYDIFFKKHFSINFCCFLYRPELECATTESMFLATAILCLCSKYFNPEQSKRHFGLDSGLDVTRLYTPIARALARAASDEPTVPNIQANLVLALSDFLDNEGSSHWMYSGTAIRMAQMIRLNKEYHQNHSLKEQEIRRRTFWACVFMDKLLAYFLTKPVAIIGANVATALPGTDASLAYQEPTRGLTLGSIGKFSGFPSEIGILPYLIKTMWLWSDITDLHVCNFRFVDKIPPLDPSSSFHQRHANLKAWMMDLPASLQWSQESYANHANIGHGREYVAMHFMIRSSYSIAHQSYLPQLDGSSILVDVVDAAGWSLLHREPEFVETCVMNALATAKMAVYLMDEGESARANLESVWVAASLFTVANTLLWIQFANDAEYSTLKLIEEAEASFNTILCIFRLWEGHWKAARQWLATLDAMRAVYRAAYLGELDDETMRELGVPATESDSPTKFRPRPGDGYLSLRGIPTLYESLRFLVSDTSAEPKMLQSVWMQFATGWPHDFVPGLAEDTFAV